VRHIFTVKDSTIEVSQYYVSNEFFDKEIEKFDLENKNLRLLMHTHDLRYNSSRNKEMLVSLIDLN